MTREEAIEAITKLCISNFRSRSGKTYLLEALTMAIEALQLVNDFESAQIITGGRLNGRTYAYKCGLADGQRLAKSEKIFNILPSVQPELNCKNCVFRTGYGTGIDEGILNALPKKMKEGE